MTSNAQAEEWVTIHATLEKASRDIETIRQDAASKEVLLEAQLKEALDKAKEMEIFAKATEEESKRREKFALASLESLAKAALDRARQKAEETQQEIRVELVNAIERLTEAEGECSRVKQLASKDKKKVKELEQKVEDLKRRLTATEEESNRKEECAKASIEALAKATIENCNMNVMQPRRISTNTEEKAVMTDPIAQIEIPEQLVNEKEEAEERARRAEVACYSAKERIVHAQKTVESEKKRVALLEHQVEDLKEQIKELKDNEICSKEALESVHKAHEKVVIQHESDIANLVQRIAAAEVERDQAKDEVILIKQAVVQQNQTAEEMEEQVLEAKTYSEQSEKKLTIATEALNRAYKVTEKMKREHAEEIDDIKKETEDQLEAMETQRDRVIDELKWTKKKLAEKRDICEKEKAKVKTLEQELDAERRKSIIQSQTAEELDRVVNELRLAAEESAREETLLRSTLCAYQSQMGAYVEIQRQNSMSSSSRDVESRKSRKRLPWSFREEKKCAD